MFYHPPPPPILTQEQIKKKEDKYRSNEIRKNALKILSRRDVSVSYAIELSTGLYDFQIQDK